MIRKFWFRATVRKSTPTPRILVNYVGRAGMVPFRLFLCQVVPPRPFLWTRSGTGFKSVWPALVGGPRRVGNSPILGYGEVTDERRPPALKGQLFKHHALAETLVFTVDVLFAPPTLSESQLAGYTQTLKLNLSPQRRTAAGIAHLVRYGCAARSSGRIESSTKPLRGVD